MTVAQSEQETRARAPPGPQLTNGNYAVVEGALYAGVHSYFGYPITPSSTIMEALAKRLPKAPVNPGVFLQCEDEIASITACIGGSWTRHKVMTATSGPGFSLMQEGIGLASFTETPLVLINVMRGGPSTGLPSYPGQQDIMQAHYGSHGDYLIPTLVPYSVQENFDFTVEAFNISEALRTPAFVFSDQILSTLNERLVVPLPGELEVIERAHPDGDPLVWKGETISPSLVPPMNCFGESKKAFCTGLSHDENGQPNLSADNYTKLLDRQRAKIETYAHLFPQPEEFRTEDAEVLLIAYGISARSAKRAVNVLRKQGIKAGLFRIRTMWPFPDKQLMKVAKDIDRIVVVELSTGQLILPVEHTLLRRVEHIPYYTGKAVPPSLIIDRIKKKGGI